VRYQRENTNKRWLHRIQRFKKIKKYPLCDERLKENWKLFGRICEGGIDHERRR
jgi:hypothetical protein